MRVDFPWPAARGPADERMFANIRSYGCTIWNVAGDDRPDFSYSIGLYTNFGHPEILVLGLPSQTAMELINLATERIRAGERFDDGARVEGLLRALSVAFVAVDRAHYADRLGIARWFYAPLGEDAFPAVQMVWPDRAGRFPWSTGADPSFRGEQAVLNAVR